MLRRARNKKIKMVYAVGGGRETTRNIPTPNADRERFCISDDEVLTLADYAIKVEKHYSAKAGQARPMDMEWAKDGTDGQLYMVQARPETVVSQRRGNMLETYALKAAGKVLASGRSIGEKIASGTVRIVTDLTHLAEFKPGEVLVADTTTPDWEPVMKTAGAVVTNRGGRTCHAAIVARELGIAAVVGADDATTALKTGDTVTMSCAEETSKIYRDESVRGSAHEPGARRPVTQIDDQPRQSRSRLQDQLRARRLASDWHASGSSSARRSRSSDGGLSIPRKSKIPPSAPRSIACAGAMRNRPTSSCSGWRRCGHNRARLSIPNP
jgi:phosphoenolpyruvate synthase/pyruvate phosphate dikinase